MAPWALICTPVVMWGVFSPLLHISVSPVLTKGCFMEVCSTIVANRLVVAGLNGSKQLLHNSIVPTVSTPPFSKESHPELLTQLML